MGDSLLSGDSIGIHQTLQAFDISRLPRWCDHVIHCFVARSRCLGSGRTFPAVLNQFEYICVRPLLIAAVYPGLRACSVRNLIRLFGLSELWAWSPGMGGKLELSSRLSIQCSIRIELINNFGPRLSGTSSCKTMTFLVAAGDMGSYTRNFLCSLCSI